MFLSPTHQSLHRPPTTNGRKVCVQASAGRKEEVLTYVDEAPRLSFAELSGLVGEADLHYSRYMSGRGLHSDGVVRDQLTPNGYCAEDNLEAIKEVLSDDDDSLPSRSPALGGRDGLDLRHQCVRVKAGQVLRAIDTPDLPPVLAVVVDEHVLADAKQGGWVHVEGR